MTKPTPPTPTERILREIFEPYPLNRLHRWLDHYGETHGYNEDDLSWEHYQRRTRLALWLDCKIIGWRDRRFRSPRYKPKRVK